MGICLVCCYFGRDRSWQYNVMKLVYIISRRYIECLTSILLCSSIYIYINNPMWNKYILTSKLLENKQTYVLLWEPERTRVNF